MRRFKQDALLVEQELGKPNQVANITNDSRVGIGH